MKISPPLEQATLITRYKRFFADIRLSNQSIFTVHCPNTGSMRNCLVAESNCWFSRSNDPKRKLKGTLEITTTPSGHKVGVNTNRPNKLVKEAIENGTITELQGYQTVQTEVRYGEENSRIDLLLSDHKEDRSKLCYIEVKNVTLEADRDPTLLRFPDAITSRGVKHLRELQLMVDQGHRAVLFFCVQHSGAQKVTAAADIDPLYAKTLQAAQQNGVEILAYGCRLQPDEIVITRKLTFNRQEIID